MLSFPVRIALCIEISLKGNTKGEIIKPRIIPRMLVRIPKMNPTTAKSSFIIISQINPSRSKVKISPGNLIVAENIKPRRSGTAPS